MKKKHLKSIMIRFLMISILLTLFVFFANAQKAYYLHNHEQVPNEELFLNQHNSMGLKKKGEFLTITGTGVALVGIILGSVATNGNSTNGDTSALTIAAVTMLAGGSIAVAIGLPMFLIGNSRVHRMNKIKYTESLKLELSPCRFYCNCTKNYSTGVSLRLRF